MELTRPALLILMVGIGPFIWGSIVYWLMSKLWPDGRSDSWKTKSADSPPPLDYQI